MNIKLSPSLRRIAAIALLLVPLALSVLFVILPLRIADRYAEAQTEIEAHIAGLEERLIGREQVMAELRHLERRSQLDTRLIEAETPAVAGAALAGSLASFLEQAGGWLESTHVLEPELDPPVMRIGVRLRGAMDIAGLRSFLYQIENAEPLLTIERISLSSEDLIHISGVVLAEIVVTAYARDALGSDAAPEQTTNTVGQQAEAR
jgi:hypothetical protein